MRIFYIFIFFLNNFYLFSDSLYCIKYGESLYNSKYIFFNDNENKYLPFDWLFYLLKTKDRVILIDCGFYSKDLIRAFGINYKNPILLLKENGFNPDSITDIIITHSHFDHIENVIFFKNAKIYIQEDEYNFFINSKYSNKDVVNFLKNNKKIVTFKEIYNFTENIIIKNIGGHSIGSSIVEIYFKNKKFILVGDEMYVKENFVNRVGVGTYFNHKKNIEFINSIKNNFEILFFHWTDKKGDFNLIYKE